MIRATALVDALYWNFMEYVVPFLICLAIGAVLYYFSRDRVEEQEKRRRRRQNGK